MHESLMNMSISISSDVNGQTDNVIFALNLITVGFYRLDKHGALSKHVLANIVLNFVTRSTSKHIYFNISNI